MITFNKHHPVSAFWRGLGSKRDYILFMAILALIVSVQIYFARGLQYEPRYDVKDLFNSAVEMCGHWQLTGENLITTARYSNNFGLALIMSRILKLTRLVGLSDFYGFVAFTMAVVDAGLCFLWAAIRRKRGNKPAFGAILAILPYIPIYVFPAQIYTDAASIAFPIASIYFFNRAYEAKTTGGAIAFAAALGLCAAIGALIKPTVAVVLIAAACSFVFLRSKRLILVLITAALAFAPLQLISSAAYKSLVPAEAVDAYKFPLSSWVMIGVSEKGTIIGSDWYDVASRQTLAERDAFARESVAERVREKGALGMAKLIARKLLYVYSEPDMQPGALIPLSNEINTPVARFIEQARNIDSHAATPYRLYNALFLYASILLCLLSLFCRDRDYVALISLFGLNAFFTFWEVTPRYAMNFLFVIIYAAALAASHLKITFNPND